MDLQKEKREISAIKWIVLGPGTAHCRRCDRLFMSLARKEEQKERRKKKGSQRRQIEMEKMSHEEIRARLVIEENKNNLREENTQQSSMTRITVDGWWK